MKFKILILLPLVIVAGHSNGFAQSPINADHKFFIKVSGGYDLLAPGSERSYSTTSSTSGDNSFSTSNVGLGAGLRFAGGLGYIVNEFLNLGVDADYLKGKKIVDNSTSSSSSVYFFNSTTTTCSVLSIIPNIVFKAISKPSYYIYNRLGLILSVNSQIETKLYDSIASISGPQIENTNSKYSYNINLGVQFAMGIQFSITKNLRGFAEVVGNYLPASPSSIKEKVAQTASSTSTISNYNLKYLKAGNYNTVSTPNSTGGMDFTGNLPLLTQNINSIGLNIGLAYRF